MKIQLEVHAQVILYIQLAIEKCYVLIVPLHVTRDERYTFWSSVSESGVFTLEESFLFCKYHSYILYIHGVFLAQLQRSMNPRKRPAAEPLLPLQAPKQPRTTMVGYDGGNPSPSERVGLISRWKRVCSDVVHLAVDTVKAPFGFIGQSLHHYLQFE
jgi:hypothetical protein